ncbi:DUF1064 domain-containing protein [Oscillibacter sp.]|uniref:DUF1064 domain-containing protein n=1 Tax=Oscillibacter sp. TaxID=1945593 RepID=UPI002897C8B9|nr:DUF1064 domain-containing protein [Oscillibacter sp.]
MSIDLSRLSPAAQKQILSKLGKQAKGNKFHNEPTSRCLQGGRPIKFPSRREAGRFDQLMLQLRAGVIRNLKLQEVFVLQAAYTTPEGAHIWGITYRADFSYERATKPDVNGEVYWLSVVEDAKGKRTDVYTMKKKLMKERLGISIVEV